MSNLQQAAFARSSRARGRSIHEGMDELTRRRIRKQLYAVLGQGSPVTIPREVARPEYVEELVDELCDECRGEHEGEADRVLKRQRVPEGVRVWRSCDWDDIHAV